MILVNVNIMNINLSSEMFVSHLFLKETTRIHIQFAPDTRADMSKRFLNIFSGSFEQWFSDI